MTRNKTRLAAITARAVASWRVAIQAPRCRRWGWGLLLTLEVLLSGTKALQSTTYGDGDVDMLSGK